MSKVRKIIILFYGLLFAINVIRSQGLNNFNCGDTLMLSITGDTALEVTSIYPVNGIMKIHFAMYSKNNKKDINFLNEYNLEAHFKEGASLVSQIPLELIQRNHLKYFAVKIPNDSLSNGDINIKTTILKTKIGEFDEKHKDTVFYCKIKQEIRYYNNLLHERKDETALMYKSLERHFDTKLYKWFCPYLQKYVISARFYTRRYDKKTDSYKSTVSSRIFFN